MFLYTRCVAFGIINCEIIEGSLHYRNYITISYLCDRKITKHYFQTINRKCKRIKAEILKTYKKYL